MNYLFIFILLLLPLSSRADIEDSIYTNFHYGFDNRTESYSHALYSFLKNQGVQVVYIKYSWSKELSDGHKYIGDVIIFKDDTGKFWAKNEKSINPKWVSGGTPIEFLNSAFPNTYNAVISVEQ